MRRFYTIRSKDLKLADVLYDDSSDKFGLVRLSDENCFGRVGSKCQLTGTGVVLNL